MSWIILVAFQSLAATYSHADQLLLRNLVLIRGRTITAFDEDGVQIGDRKIPWDQIQRGTVATEKQAEFDRLLQELGEPLFRLRVRLRFGDYQSLGSFAESLYPRYSDRNSQTAFMVAHALMKSRITAGHREEAVEPYLRCLAYLLNSNDRLIFPGQRSLSFSSTTGLTPSLVPVWFDSDAAKRVLPKVREAVRLIKHPRPEGVYLYYASLALSGGDNKAALDTIKLVSGE
ncbi:MAG: hypothetical protein IH991_03410, partial [Planctomycetes bacterium]|nr:hypothetical protein [Planctomycetota bacterium]